MIGQAPPYLVVLCPTGTVASLQVAPAGLLLNITFLPVGSWQAASPLAGEAVGKPHGGSVITSVCPVDSVRDCVSSCHLTLFV